MTLRKHYKELAHMIICQAKKTKIMKRYDYQHIVKPYLTILREKPLSEVEVLKGFANSRIKFVWQWQKNPSERKEKERRRIKWEA